MPKSCPACGRPNADRATQCLYCTGPLEPMKDVEPEGPAGEITSFPKAPSSDRHLIILAPQLDASATDANVEAFAAAAGLSRYDARLALLTQRHRVLRKVEDAQKAAVLSKRIEALGVTHLSVPESEVEALPVVRIRGLRLEPDHIELGLSGEEIARIGDSELLLLVRGEIARARHHERHLATARGAKQPLASGARLHFYGIHSSVAAELDPEQFDWSALEPDSLSTPINFKRLVDEIVDRTKVKLDRGFDLEPVVLSRSQADSEVDSLLGTGQGNHEGVFYDNEAQFRFYARWRFLVARANWQARSVASR